MKIKGIIWLKEFADKIEWKHGVTEDEVDEVLGNSRQLERWRVD